MWIEVCTCDIEHTHIIWTNTFRICWCDDFVPHTKPTETKPNKKMVEKSHGIRKKRVQKEQRQQNKKGKKLKTFGLLIMLVEWLLRLIQWKSWTLNTNWPLYYLFVCMRACCWLFCCLSDCTQHGSSISNG